VSLIDRSDAKCSGCLACELSCSMRHVGYFDPSKSRIRIIQNEELSEIEIHQCCQCDERSCVKACVDGALSIDPRYGYIVYDRDACTQCRKCYRACQYHGVQWDEQDNLPLICDRCIGDPECVKPCRLHEALVIARKEVSQ